MISPELETTAVAVDGLVAESASGVRLLDGVSFRLAAGELVAVAGPTGAGKTSLARALTGVIPLTAGRVVVNGRDVTSLDPSRRGIGYVPQEDPLHAELSVRRTLAYAAELRLMGLDADHRAARVDAVLDETRLRAQADRSVAALSVGQRKRVSIATELLGDPAVLVLDEPTSSLDPGYEASVMATLRRLADLGHCVVVVTHSQSVIADCDRVVMLAAGGRLAYAGSPDDLHSYFGTSSAAELFTLLDEGAPYPAGAVASGVPPAASTTGAVDQSSSGGRRRLLTHQLLTLSRRYRDLMFADRRRAWLLGAQGVTLGLLLLAFVTQDGLARPVHALSYGAPVSATGMAVLLVMCVTWLGMSNSIREIVKERHIVAREHRAGLSPAAYVGSKIAVLGPLLAAQAAVVTVFAVGRQRVPSTGAVLPSGLAELVVAMALAGLSAVTLGLFISALVRSADKALAVLPMLVVVEFVLSGLTPSVSWMPGLAQLRDLAGTRWAVKAISSTVIGDARGWWLAIGALVALNVVALAGTYLAVRRSLRLPVARAAKPSLAQRLHAVAGRANPEMVRLSRFGVAGLVGVALLVAAGRVAIPLGPAAGTPVAAAAVAPAAPQAASDASDPLVAELPPVIGDMWWMLRTGAQFGLDVSEAAYLRSSLS